MDILSDGFDGEASQLYPPGERGVERRFLGPDQIKQALPLSRVLAN